MFASHSWHQNRNENERILQHKWAQLKDEMEKRELIEAKEESVPSSSGKAELSQIDSIKAKMKVLSNAGLSPALHPPSTTTCHRPNHDARTALNAHNTHSTTNGLPRPRQRFLSCCSLQVAQHRALRDGHILRVGLSRCGARGSTTNTSATSNRHQQHKNKSSQNPSVQLL